MCSVAQEAPNNIAQVKTLCNVVLEAPDDNAQEKIKFNVADAMLSQRLQKALHNKKSCAILSYFSWDNIVQVKTLGNVVRLRGSRQHCIRKNPVQFCFNTLGETLCRSKPYEILSERLQTTLHKKTSCAMLP